MAIMNDADRQEGWADFMRNIPPGESYSITKTDLRTTYNAADQWASDNAASFNTTLPQPARSAMSTAEKARLLNWVVRQRYIKGA